MLQPSRRYDIDWVRVIAIGLLLLYHTAIGFQPWGTMIGFITSEKSWTSLWTGMLMLNIWRIPLLFYVSGMGVYFAIQNRSAKELLLERRDRILIPLLFGMFFICPVSVWIWQYYYHRELKYDFHPAHLWFLGNIFIYVLVMTPVFYFSKRKKVHLPDSQGKLVTGIKKLLSHPLGLVLVIAAFVAEVILVDPKPYEMYVMTSHGFLLGLLAFLIGFCFAMSGDPFWNMMLKWRWLFITVAAMLYTHRLFQFQMQVPGYLLAIESNFWIFSVFAFSYRYLKHPSKALDYLSQAVYPVYIIHMIFLFLGSMLIFPLDIEIHLQFILVLIFTATGSFITYEFIIRRVKFLRPLFGLKMK